MSFTTPHGTARYRLPWSWSAFDYRELCDELWAQCGDARFETAKVDGSSRADGEIVVHTDRGDLHGAARRRRARLAPRAGEPALPAAGRPAVARARGPPAHDGSGDALDVWVERALVRRGYGWRVPARRRGAHRRRLLRPARARQASRSSSWPRGSASSPTATRATGSRTGCAPRPRTASSSSATAPATASRSRARASAPRSTSASPRGRELRAVLAGEPPARARAGALRRVQRRATGATFACALRSSG